MENTVKIVAKDGNADVRVGLPVVELEHYVVTTYRADTMEDFKAFVDRLEGTTAPARTYCGQKEIKVYLGDLAPFKNDRPVAEISIENSGWLAGLVGAEGHSMSLEQTERLVQKYRHYANKDAMNLYEICRNLSVSKVVNVERKKERNGDCRYRFETASGPEDDSFPETVGFSVPLFLWSNDLLVNIEFDVQFDYELTSEKPRMNVVLDCADIDEVIRRRKREVVDLELKSVPHIWGVLSLFSESNKARYHEIGPIS